MPRHPAIASPDPAVSARAPRSQPRRRLWLWLHRWAGLVLALHLLLLGLTGAVLVWHIQLDRWLNPELLRRPVGAGQVGWDVALQAGREALQGSGCSVMFPPVPEAVYRVICKVAEPTAGTAAGASRWVEAFVSPVDGRLLGVRERGHYALDRRHVVRTLYKLHAQLLAGDIGNLLVGLSGLLLVGGVLSGGVLWWPRTRPQWRQAWKVRFDLSTLRALFDLHRVSGIVLLPLLLALAASGLYLTFPKQVEWVVGATLELAEVPPPPAAPGGLELAELARRAAGYLPGATLTEVEAPDAGSALWTFYFRTADSLREIHGVSVVKLSGTDGQLLQRYDEREAASRQTLLELMFPLHNGEVLGLPGRVIVTGMGLFVPLLAVTGVWLWLKRRK